MLSYEINDLLEKKNNVIDIYEHMRIIDSPQVTHARVLSEEQNLHEVITNDDYKFTYVVKIEE